MAVLTFLLPGFVAAAVFYSLTSHPKPSNFERVVQALIFTIVVEAVGRSFFLVSGTFWTKPLWSRRLGNSVFCVDRGSRRIDLSVCLEQ